MICVMNNLILCGVNIRGKQYRVGFTTKYPQLPYYYVTNARAKSTTRIQVAHQTDLGPRNRANTPIRPVRQYRPRAYSNRVIGTDHNIRNRVHTSRNISEPNSGRRDDGEGRGGNEGI